MTRAEIYRTRERVAERGDKPAFYVVVSQSFIAENDDVSVVVWAPVYSEILGLRTEVVLGPEDGLPRTSAARCDFLNLTLQAQPPGVRGLPFQVEDGGAELRPRWRSGTDDPAAVS